jgi:adenylate kinase
MKIMRNRNFTCFEIFIILVLIVGALCSIVIYIYCFWGYAFGIDPEAFGTFGSYFGGVVGCICSLVGIVFLYRTYKTQLDITYYQEKFQIVSKFEDNFFELLSQQRDICKSISNKYTTSNGRRANIDNNEFFNALRHDFQKRLENNLGYESLEDSINIQKVRLSNIYQEFFEGYSHQLGHYFRHLYHILKYIDDTESLDEQKKREYSDLLQAQMSNDELYLTAMNGISNYGRHKLLPLLDKYGFLENLYVKDEISNVLIGLFYPKTKRKTLNGDMKNVIFLGGVHCSGKGLLSAELCKKYTSLFSLTASEVIKWKDTGKIVTDVEQNQMLFEEKLQRIVDVDVPYILDGHFCLWEKNFEIKKVPMHTFNAINPFAVILVEAEATEIKKRLKERDGIDYELSNIVSLQKLERSYAEEVANKLNVKFMVYESVNDKTKVEAIIRDFLSQFS